MTEYVFKNNRSSIKKRLSEMKADNERSRKAKEKAKKNHYSEKTEEKLRKEKIKELEESPNFTKSVIIKTIKKRVRIDGIEKVAQETELGVELLRSFLLGWYPESFGMEKARDNLQNYTKRFEK